MTKTERTLTEKAATQALYAFIRCAKHVGIDKTCDTIDPSDETDMWALVNSVCDDTSKRQIAFFENMGSEHRKRFFANIADQANGAIRYAKRFPHIYGL